MKAIYNTYNKQTKKYEAISESAIQSGQTVVRFFWSATHKQYFTVPGASICRMNDEGELVVVE